MANLIVSFEVVAPLLILMLLGAMLLRIHIFDESTVKKMNTAVFKVFLPALIFNNVYNSSIDDVKNIGTALYTAVVIVGAFALTMLLVCFLEKDNAKRGVMVQGMCRSNFRSTSLRINLWRGRFGKGFCCSCNCCTGAEYLVCYCAGVFQRWKT